MSRLSLMPMVSLNSELGLLRSFVTFFPSFPASSERLTCKKCQPVFTVQDPDSLKYHLLRSLSYADGQHQR